MRVVLDTNVVASALLWGGTPRVLLQAAREKRIELFTSTPMRAGSTPASSMTLRAASVAAWLGVVPGSHQRRASMPAMPVSMSLRMPKRSHTGARRSSNCEEGTRWGASTWARPAMTTCSNCMGGSG